MCVCVGLPSAVSVKDGGEVTDYITSEKMGILFGQQNLRCSLYHIGIEKKED